MKVLSKAGGNLLITGMEKSHGKSSWSKMETSRKSEMIFSWSGIPENVRTSNRFANYILDFSTVMFLTLAVKVS